MEPSQQEVLVLLDGKGLPPEVYEAYDLCGLEEQIDDALERAGVGELDGNEIGPGQAALFLYGPDADALYRAIQLVLEKHPLCQNGIVVLPPKGPNSPGREIRIQGTKRGPQPDSERD